MKKIVIAPDSFKESLTALEVARAIEKGLKKIWPDTEYHLVPMADGGEGTLQTLVNATNGTFIETTVKNPIGEKIKSKFGVSQDNSHAFIEMATASGLELITEEKRNPYVTSTYGTGQLIKTALDMGIRKFTIGIGGSATNDGGSGMLKALGFRFLKNNDVELEEGGYDLINLKKIDLTKIDPRLKESTFMIACDVNNPLCGENGASAVFGPQKGATQEMVKILDSALLNYANIIHETLGIDIKNFEGSGAAGGIGAAFLAFMNANLKKGIDIVIEITKLDEVCKEADIVFTGEGKIDYQTIYGKTPIGVAKIAKKHNVKVIALAGTIGDGYEKVYDHGIDAIFPIISSISSKNEIFAKTSKNLELVSESIARTLR